MMEVVESCNQTLGVGMSEESILELSKALDSVRVPDGVSPLQVAFETAKLQLITFKSRFGRLRNYNPLFLSFCYHLQISLGKEDMPLSEDAIARVFVFSEDHLKLSGPGGEGGVPCSGFRPLSLSRNISGVSSQV